MYVHTYCIVCNDVCMAICMCMGTDAIEGEETTQDKPGLHVTMYVLDVGIAGTRVQYVHGLMVWI